MPKYINPVFKEKLIEYFAPYAMGKVNADADTFNEVHKDLVIIATRLTQL